MTGQRHHTTGSEAVALFHDVKSLQAAIDELLTSGFDRADLSVLGNEKAIEDKLGHNYGIWRTIPMCRGPHMSRLRVSALRRPHVSVRLSI